jgi:tetratricopeptide (TPR) repeat protein
MIKKRLSTLAIALFCSANMAFSQGQLTLPTEGGSKKAMVSEYIGLTEISVAYGRPAVRGREGKVWGDIVPFGNTDQGFGTSKSAPWRAGANENTVISFSTDVKVEGKPLKAGKYGLFMTVVSENEVIVIFSKNAQAWGSYFYDPANDALQVTVKPKKVDASKEFLEYEFMNQTRNSADIVLAWEKWQIPFKIEVDVTNTVLASIREELKSSKGFEWQSWNQAASYCLRNNTNLEEGLIWAENAISLRGTGEKNFTTLSTKAMILAKLGKQSEADALMKEALPMGAMMEVHSYGRQLIAQKKYNEALEVFKMNAKKNPTNWTPSWGLARGYSAVGDFKNALKYAELALTQKPDEQNKKNIENSIPKLKEKKDINQ